MLLFVCLLVHVFILIDNFWLWMTGIVITEFDSDSRSILILSCLLRSNRRKVKWSGFAIADETNKVGRSCGLRAFTAAELNWTGVEYSSVQLGGCEHVFTDWCFSVAAYITGWAAPNAVEQDGSRWSKTLRESTTIQPWWLNDVDDASESQCGRHYSQFPNWQQRRFANVGALSVPVWLWNNIKWTWYIRIGPPTVNLPHRKFESSLVGLYCISLPYLADCLFIHIFLEISC